MHVPDGFLDAPTSLATAGVSAVAIGLSLRGARRELDERTVPLAGLVAVFVFAAQMINFPVGAGTSGHLMGGALAAVLIGPWSATLAVSVVIIVQALAFADGGLTAMGTNVLLIAVVTAWVGWGVFRLLQLLLPKSLKMIPFAAAAGAFVSVPAAALVFVGLWAIGGAAPIDLGLLATTMLGWHLIIGVGEAVITGLAVSAVLAARPDIVYAARPLMRDRTLEIRSATEVVP